MYVTLTSKNILTNLRRILREKLICTDTFAHRSKITLGIKWIINIAYSVEIAL